MCKFSRCRYMTFHIFVAVIPYLFNLIQIRTFWWPLHNWYTNLIRINEYLPSHGRSSIVLHKQEIGSHKSTERHHLFYYNILKIVFSIHRSRTDRNLPCASIKVDATPEYNRTTSKWNLCRDITRSKHLSWSWSGSFTTIWFHL